MAIIFAAAIYTRAQTTSTLKPFKVDVSVGYAMPAGKGSKAGVLIAVEPKYAVMENLSVGIRFEGAIIARFSGYNDDGTEGDADVKAHGSYLATGDYYFSNNYSARPFLGVGVGLFSLAGTQISSTTSGVDVSTNKFGSMLRGGVELKHFRLGLEYNIIPQTKFSGYNNNGDPAELKAKNSYLGIKVGVCIGGGKK